MKMSLSDFQLLIPDFSGILIVLIEKRFTDLNDRGRLALALAVHESVALAVKVDSLIGKGVVVVANPDGNIVALMQRQQKIGIRCTANGDRRGEQGVGVAGGNGDGTGHRNTAAKRIGNGATIVLIEKAPSGIDDRGVLAVALTVNPGMTLPIKIGAGIGQNGETGTIPQGNPVAFLNCVHDGLNRIAAAHKRGTDWRKSIAARQWFVDIPDDVLRIGICP